jgi:hypothetical protein
VSGSLAEAVQWARDHHAGFELEPLVVAARGRRVHVGFTIRLYADLPVDARPHAERWSEAAEIQATLRQLLESLAPPDGGAVRLEIEPSRALALVVPGGDRAPEIAVRARVFHSEDYFVTAREEKRIYAQARRLAEMGLQERLRPRP